MAALVPTSRLGATPVRERENGFSSVERSRILTPVVPDGVATVTPAKTIRLNGLLTTILSSAPDIPTDANFTVALINEDGITEYTSGNIADNSKVATNVASAVTYLCGNYTMKLTFSTVLSGNTAEFDIQFLTAYA